MPHFHEDPAEPDFVAAHLQRLGVHPSRLQGQHFLIAPDVADALVAAADLPRGAHVLEIGPGLGAITERLSHIAETVHAVEVEHALAAALVRRFADRPHVQIVEGDILRLAREAVLPPDTPYHCVASLPYSITSRVLRVFLSEQPVPQTMTFLLQREVAERATAPVGKLSQLGLLCQLYGRPMIIGPEVPPAAFLPAPKVTSSILHIADIPEAAHARATWGVSERSVWKFIRAGFQNRRKMLKNTLANLPGVSAEEVTSALKTLGYVEKARAQDLAPKDWVKMAKMFFDETGQ